MILNESGSVAKDRIYKNDLINAFSTVDKIVATLKDKNMIKEDPKFDLGSTKTAYRMFKKNLNQIEK